MRFYPPYAIVTSFADDTALTVSGKYVIVVVVVVVLDRVRRLKVGPKSEVLSPSAQPRIISDESYCKRFSQLTNLVYWILLHNTTSHSEPFLGWMVPRAKLIATLPPPRLEYEQRKYKSKRKF